MRKQITLYLFILTLLSPLLMRELFSEVEMENNENRTMTPKPVYGEDSLTTANMSVWNTTHHNLTEYTQKYEGYFNDNFILKNQLNKYWSRFQKWTRTSPRPDDVILGKEDWLFLGNSYSNGAYTHLGIDTLTAADIEWIVATELQKKAFCDSANINYYLLIPPSKEEVYPEYYPIAVKQGVKRSYQRLMERLRQCDINFIDIYDTLTIEKQLNQVYYKTDSHWNTYGSVVGYEALMTAIRKKFPEIPMLTKEDYIMVDQTVKKMDLAKIWGMEIPEETKVCALKSPTYMEVEKTLNLTRYELGGAEKRFVNPSKIGYVVMFGDSFSDHVKPWLSQTFGASVFLHLGYANPFDKEVILQEKPQFVISEVTSRNLGLLGLLPQ